MFLIGGPAFSGTTLLAHLLNQGRIICLDEPDFHNPRQSHRAIPFLQQLFPGKQFPRRPERELTYHEAINLIRECEAAISSYNLGFKTCNQIFIDYARFHQNLGYPVIAMIRDIRDALIRPLPPWMNEEKLNHAYRLVWDNLNLCDLWIRYEDLISNPEKAMAKISALLDYNLEVRRHWEARSVHGPMLKLDRHELLKSGMISESRVGIWKTSGKVFSDETCQTAKLMGYF
jgi:hypothetical protein